MKNWAEKLKGYPIFFISPDVKRGLGLEDLLPDYHLLCSYADPLNPVLTRTKARLFCLEDAPSNKKNLPKNSGNLLSDVRVQNYIKNHSTVSPYISYFKPSLKIDFLLKKYKYRSIGNHFELNEKFENKIKFTKTFS